VACPLGSSIDASVVVLAIQSRGSLETRVLGPVLAFSGTASAGGGMFTKGTLMRLACSIVLAWILMTVLGCHRSTPSSPQGSPGQSPPADKDTYARTASSMRVGSHEVVIAVLGLRMAGGLWTLDIAAGADSSDVAQAAADECVAHLRSDPSAVGIATANGQALQTVQVLTSAPDRMIHPPRSQAELLVKYNGIYWFMASSPLRTSTQPVSGTYVVTLPTRNLALGKPILDGWVIAFPNPTTVLVAASSSSNDK
jgi:hypothetical protein